MVMAGRTAKIETADAELAATYEMCQAMKRFWSYNDKGKRRAVLHMAMRYMCDDVKHSDGEIWLKLK
jgi:hypothetical protein